MQFVATTYNAGGTTFAVTPAGSTATASDIDEVGTAGLVEASMVTLVPIVAWKHDRWRWGW